MRDYMDRRLTPPKRVTSPTRGPPAPCKRALRKRVSAVSNFITLVPFHTSFLMLGNSSGVDSKELYLSSEKERENRCLALTSSIVKLETVEVSRGSRATIDGKLESTKKRDTHAGLLFCLSKPIAFSPSSFLLVMVANPKHYPDLDSDTSQVWNFCARSSDIILPEM